MVTALVQGESLWLRYGAVTGLALTTTLSVFLLIASSQDYHLPTSANEVIIHNRASLQIAIQLLSGPLGFNQVSTVTMLINYATRLRLRQGSITINHLCLWMGLCLTKFDKNISWRSLPLLGLFLCTTFVPAALWTGALTPAQSQAFTRSIVETPVYSVRAGNIKEWPSQVDSGSPTIYTAKGLFSYAVGMRLLGPLLSAASSATTVDGSIRIHTRADYTGYTYIGRSYGIGTSPGLTVYVSDVASALSYTYVEHGYNSEVNCLYNSSSDFALVETDTDNWYEASGYLPDSVGGSELSQYIGYGTATIVAIGVAYSAESPRRYLAIAAGSGYSDLNNVQCTVDFIPALFNVSVSVVNKTIQVGFESWSDIDIDPTRNLTKTAMRQYELISNDQTNLYMSLLGNSSNTSINSYDMYMTNTNQTMSRESIVLGGVKNSLTAMMDDILIGYGSAQLMIAQAETSQPATVVIRIFKIGDGLYIYLIAALNALVCLAYLAEALRTRGWRELPTFDYLNVCDLIVGASYGGKDLAYKASKQNNVGTRSFNMHSKDAMPCISVESESHPLPLGKVIATDVESVYGDEEHQPLVDLVYSDSRSALRRLRPSVVRNGSRDEREQNSTSTTV